MCTKLTTTDIIITNYDIAINHSKKIITSVFKPLLWNPSGFVTMCQTIASLSWQACTRSTVRLTAMVKVVAVHWLVQLNSLMHVAGAGLLSQHGWDTGYSCLSAAFMHANTHKL